MQKVLNVYVNFSYDKKKKIFISPDLEAKIPKVVSLVFNNKI